MTTLIETSGLTSTQHLSPPLGTANDVAYLWQHITAQPLESDVDSFFSQFEGSEDFQKGKQEASQWLAETLYPEEVTLKKLRLQKGLTQKELSLALGMQQPQWAKLENAESPDPKLSTLMKLSEVLEVSIDKLAEAMTSDR